MIGFNIKLTTMTLCSSCDDFDCLGDDGVVDETLSDGWLGAVADVRGAT